MNLAEELYLQEGNKDKKGLIPSRNVIGNDILENQFDNDFNKVYLYCVITDKTWSEVLKYKEEPNAIY